MFGHFRVKYGQISPSIRFLVFLTSKLDILVVFCKLQGQLLGDTSGKNAFKHIGVTVVLNKSLKN